LVRGLQLSPYRLPKGPDARERGRSGPGDGSMQLHEIMVGKMKLKAITTWPLAIRALLCLVLILVPISAGALDTQALDLGYSYNAQPYVDFDGSVHYLGNAGGAGEQRLAADAIVDSELGKPGEEGGEDTQWWSYDYGHYTVNCWGDGDGPYSYYAGVRDDIASYLDAAYDAASWVVGKDAGTTIDLWLTYDESAGAYGWFYPADLNAIYLNTYYERSGAEFCNTIAHETTHLIFEQSTSISSRDYLGASWLHEALAFYAGSCVYTAGPQYGYGYLSDLYRTASDYGALRSSWYSSGADYASGAMDALDYAQMNTIGYYLASWGAGLSAMHGVVDHIASGLGIDTAFSAVYGVPPGQYSTEAGEGVNTLYSMYLAFYLGEDEETGNSD
jgi:hypothetical protein